MIKQKFFTGNPKFLERLCLMQARPQITAGRETKRLFRSGKVFPPQQPCSQRAQSRGGSAELKGLKPPIPQAGVLGKPFSSAWYWRHPHFPQTQGLHCPAETPPQPTEALCSSPHRNPPEGGFCCPGGVSPLAGKPPGARSSSPKQECLFSTASIICAAQVCPSAPSPEEGSCPPPALAVLSTALTL